MRAPPEDVKLSREDGAALIERIPASSRADADQGLLIKLIRLYCWFTFALSETRISLKRLKRVRFAGGKPPPPPPPAGGASSGGAADGGAGTTAPHLTPARPRLDDRSMRAADRAARRRGHGRQGAAVYPGAERLVCRHETLAAGQRCPAGGRGTWYPLPASVESRIDGNALLSAIRYEVEKLGCSACEEVLTAPRPVASGPDKYSPTARAVIALRRYYLGLPFYRMEQSQALVGVPVADATLWELAERVADAAWPVFEA